MDNETNKKPFPVARFVGYGNFHYYYAYGNTPAEDFLRCLHKEENPDILLLGCGDLRSCFYTIWKNFRTGIERRFNGVHWVLNDYSSAILARDILFVHLCLKMPQESTAMKEWICALWAIWFCHELLPNHKKVLRDGLGELIELSQSHAVWMSTSNSLSKLVKFSSPNTLQAVRQTWMMWHNQEVSIKSVKQMNEDRLAQQGSKIPDIKMMAKAVVMEFFDISEHSHSKEQMEDEVLCYLRSGNTYAEDVLGTPCSGDETTINFTFYERQDGKYTLHYASVPFKCFLHSCPFSERLMPSLGTFQIVVRSTCFELKPLLSNSIQQFSLWLSTCACVLNEVVHSMEHSPFTFCFHLSDAVDICLALQNPDLSASLNCQTSFDVVFSSNLIDHIGVSNLVLTVLPVLKSSGRLFTTSLLYKLVALTGEEYLQALFGVDITLLPVLFGVRCINHEGNAYSSEVSGQPVPVQFGHLAAVCQFPKLFIWEKTFSLPLKHPCLFEYSSAITKNLCHAICTATTALVTQQSKGQGTFNLLCTETVMKILLSFIGNVDGDVSNYLFWEPLCSLLLQQNPLKPFIHCLQTQAFLHKIHLHLNANQSTCPLCLALPLTNYIGQFSIKIRIQNWNETPCFLVFIHKSSTHFLTAHELQLMAMMDPSVHIVDSIDGITTKTGLMLEFYLPLTFLNDEYSFTIVSYKERVYTGYLVSTHEFTCNFPSIVSTHALVQAFKCAGIDHTFQSANSSVLIPQTSFGTIKLNYGDGNSFETAMLLSEESLDSITHNSLVPRQISPSEIEMSTGPHKYSLHYPYPVDYNRVSIKISKTKKTVTVLVSRMKHAFVTDLPIFMFNPSDELSMPHTPFDNEIMDRYCKLQFTKSERENAAKCKGEYTLKSPLTNLKETLLILFNSQRENFFQVSLCSPALNIRGLIVVEDRHFDLELKTPVIHIAFCFLSPSTVFAVSSGWKAINVRRTDVCSIFVNDKELELLEAALNYFVLGSVRCAHDFANTKYLQCLKQHKISHFFKEAVVHPLYSDPDTFAQDLKDDVDSLLDSVKQLQFSHTSANNAQCDYCATKKADLMKCAACGDARYCGKDCQKKHWKVHKNDCKTLQTQTGYKGANFDQQAQKDPAPLFKTSTTDLSCCDFCRMKSITLKKCAACRKALYCSKDCQSKDWKRHKQVCTKLQMFESQDHARGGSLLTSVTDAISKCTGCEKESLTLRQCPCHKAVYCSKSCQRMDWTRHKPNCTAH